MAENSRAELGQRILFAARNELYMNFPYLDGVLCALRFSPGDEVTLRTATDGEVLYYNTPFLSEQYLRGSAAVNRVYLHTVLHCMLRHLAKKRGRDGVLWDIACDAAAESILDGLAEHCLGTSCSPARQKFYGECRCDMPVLTAEGIYRRLLREKRSEYELAVLQRLFLADDHGLWDRERNDDRSERQDREWKSRAERTQTGMETVLAGAATGGETLSEQLRVELRDDVDYRAFLRRITALREVMHTDDDAFDYGYYAYGLAHYGNMPLLEPPETREERRIEELVIAVDTSMSTSGEPVRSFLRCTYALLRQSETYTRRLNIRILQCDNAVRVDTLIRSHEELAEYMASLRLVGGSATDFRPVFDYVSHLQSEGAFTDLRGLIYLTDGMGIYPQKRPCFDAAFVLLEEPPLHIEMPPWAIRLVLTENALERAAAQVNDSFDDGAAQELPEL